VNEAKVTDPPVTLPTYVITKPAAGARVCLRAPFLFHHSGARSFTLNQAVGANGAVGPGDIAMVIANWRRTC
jgi:hypothetical protein